MTRLSVVLVASAACSTPPHIATVEVERNTPAVRGGKLIEALGIETLGRLPSLSLAARFRARPRPPSAPRSIASPKSQSLCNVATANSHPRITI